MAAVRLSVLDLDRRIAVVRVSDDGDPSFVHVLRGTLAAMIDDASWHIVVAFMDEEPPRPAVVAVLDQARRWAGDAGCRLSVTTLRDLSWVAKNDP
ncbi:MAG TPA: hypothetical protein VFQ85_15435 [Mycobacteriales bacterium]|nr:hypothetical protein [Mycobacteriales bacterium]